MSDPVKIIVFGSYARGDFGVDSDLDLLVIIDNVNSPRMESIRLRRALRGLLFPIDVIVATPQHIERYQDIQGLVYHDALIEGKVIYEQTPTN